MKAREIFFALPARLLFTARANLIRHPFVACATGLLMLAACPSSALANKEARWTLSILLSTRPVHEVVELVRALEAGHGGGVVSASRQTVTIAAPASEIERLVHIIREIDDPYTAGQRIWTIEARGVASGLASNLDALVDRDRGWPTGSKIPKFIPDDLGHRVIVMADEPGYSRIKRLRLELHIDPCRETDPIELPIGPRGEKAAPGALPSPNSLPHERPMSGLPSPRNDRHDLLVVVGHEAGYQRMRQVCLDEPGHEGM